MSEDFSERLSRFTPDGGALDRDALLFAAGRASARPPRRWAVLSGVLAASQLLTLAVLWPRPAPPGNVPFAHIAPPAVVPVVSEESNLAPDAGPLTSWASWQPYAQTPGKLPPLRPVAGLRPDAPPLRACLALYDTLPF